MYALFRGFRSREFDEDKGAALFALLDGLPGDSLRLLVDCVQCSSQDCKRRLRIYVTFNCAVIYIRLRS